MSQKMAITGGAGFIGSNLAEALAKENEVIIIDDLSSGKLENLAGIEAKFVRGSITDKELLRNEFLDVDCIFHLAAVPSVQKSIEDPIRINQINLDGTLNVLIAARDAEVKHMVFASSAAVYGDSSEVPKKEYMVPQPKSPYAVTKVAGEHYCKVFSEIYGLQTVVLRLFNVFGPKQDPNSEYSGVISRFISSILTSLDPVVFGDGEQTRDFVFVNDAVRAFILASRSKSSKTYNVARGQGASLNQLIQIIGKIVGSEIRPRFLDARSGDIKHSLADISEAESIGYYPRFPLEEGLKRTVDWMSKYILLNK
ncbi:MAG: SDR family oxidoreductase [Methanotrichaceae archaeon]|nr:SDR family oxidoreductase [Methanotrichaceae archaeon]